MTPPTDPTPKLSNPANFAKVAIDPDPTLAEIRELVPRLETLGRMPEKVTSLYGDYFYTIVQSPARQEMGFPPIRAKLEPTHALDILRGAAERGLRSSPYEIAYCPREDAYISLFHGNDVVASLLPAALDAEIERRTPSRVVSQQSCSRKETDEH